MPVSNRDVRLVQVAYPQIYFACHTRHIRRASTGTRLSAAIARLAKLGYVAAGKAVSDRRAIDLLLSAKGAAAMQASSVLDAALVAKMLARLSASERKHALEGVGLLAKGARLAQGDRK